MASKPFSFEALRIFPCSFNALFLGDNALEEASMLSHEEAYAFTHGVLFPCCSRYA